MLSFLRQNPALGRRFVVNSFGQHADIVNHLHRALSRIWPATTVDARNVQDAVAQMLGRLSVGEKIRRIQFWGHGRPGVMCIGDEELSAESFQAEHPHHPPLVQLRSMLRDDAVICFKGCQTFAGADGKNFARIAVTFFGRAITVSGQSRLLGFNLDWGGAVNLKPGQEPHWPDVDLKDKALKKQGNGIVGRMARLLRRARSGG